MRVLVVYNPTAGRRAAGNVAEDLRARLCRAGDDVEVCPTAPVGGAKAPVGERIKDVDRVVVIGGDGSLRETLSALGPRRGEVDVGVVPCGNANVIARELHIPLDVGDALECLLCGPVREIDVAQVQDEIFLAMVGIGWDARTVAYVSALRTRPLGRWAYGLASDAMYVVAGLLAAASRTTEFTLRLGERSHRCLGAIVCNASVYGKGWSMYPEASLFSHSLHVHLASRGGIRALVRRLAAASRRRRAAPELSDYFDAQSAGLDADEAVPVHLDGDDFGLHRSLEMRIHPASARLIVPRDAA